MITIKTFVFNPFQENTYVVSDETGECVVIDAGSYSASEERALADYIRGNGLKPVMALNTHGHVDHILGVGNITETYSVPFVLHGKDRFLIESAAEHGAIYGFTVGQLPSPEVDLDGQQLVRFGHTEFTVIHTPGHTPGHVAFFDQQSRSLFTGDTLFRESIGRTDLPGGDYSWIMRSILENIMPLGSDVTIYPGHGPSSTLGHEALYNPFITEVLGGEVKYEN